MVIQDIQLDQESNYTQKTQPLFRNRLPIKADSLLIIDIDILLSIGVSIAYTRPYTKGRQKKVYKIQMG